MESEILSPNALFRQPPTLSGWLPQSATRPVERRAYEPTASPLQPDLATHEASLQRVEPSKRKQCKSRSGCITCKNRRIKCDEAKPACLQCAKRNVECEGYKLQYKWRSFDDTSKPPPKARKPTSKETSVARGDDATQGYVRVSNQQTSSVSEVELSRSPDLSSGSLTAPSIASEYLSLVAEDAASNPSEEHSSFQYDLPLDLESGFQFYNSDIEFISAAPISPSQSSGSFDKVPDEETFRNCVAPGTTQPNSAHSSIRASPTAGFGSLVDSLQSRQATSFHTMYFDDSSPEMLLLRFDKETCGILSIKDGPNENPWRTFMRPLAKDCEVLHLSILAMAALHGASNQPRLRIVGMRHMTKAISQLSIELQNMSENQILASALALCISEGWDDKISTGVKHLMGAKNFLNNALSQWSRSMTQGQPRREEAELHKFLSNTFVYLDAIARLTSSEEHDTINLEHAISIMNEPIDSEIDPLMGCATTLFPLLGKVASLVHRIRTTTLNSLKIISEANELREELLHWEPPDMYSFEEPRDPNSNVRHVLQTAEAYRRAILLHLHSAVTELSSEPSHDQAQATLRMLAATPLSSRTMIVQIFPLLVASCEMVQPEDRKWVTERWGAMMNRLSLVNVSSCWKVVQEVWRRRDQWVETRPQQTRPTSGRSTSSGAIPFRTNHRNMIESRSSSGPGRTGDFHEIDNMAHDRFYLARDKRSPFEAPDSPPLRRSLVRLPRNHTDVSLLSGAVEYTVRGQLHWLGVMSDWNWEGKSQPPGDTRYFSILWLFKN